MSSWRATSRKTGRRPLAVDFRLLGFGVRRQPLATLAHDVRPWMVGALAVMIVSGGLLFSSEALKCGDKGACWMKMEFLVAALVTFTLRSSYTQRDVSRLNPIMSRFVAITSMALWLGVGVGGRGVGFY